MASPRLAPSLRNLFREFDARWPHRDRRTDGWYADPRDRISYGHNPDPAGWVHAIDVDKDGISPQWVIDNIHRAPGIIWYIIWYEHIWSMDYGWRKLSYDGPNPHHDHMHIEIRHSATARDWGGSWNLAAIGHGSMGTAPEADEFGAADIYPEVKSTSDFVLSTGDNAYGYGKAIAALRH